MDNRRSKTIESKASEILNHFSMSQPGFDVFDLISKLNIRCVHSPDLPSNISGASMTEDGLKVITINASQAPQRKRFTAAHELGHIVLAHDTALNISEGQSQTLYRNDLSSLGADWREVEANHFAACLLMPREFVEREISASMITEDEVTALAQKFGVSSTAMSIRLSKLGYL